MIIFSCKCRNYSVASLQNISRNVNVVESWKVVKTQRGVFLFLKILADVILVYVTKYPGIKTCMPTEMEFIQRNSTKQGLLF